MIAVAVLIFFMPSFPPPITYRLSRMRATPYPNRLLEHSLTLTETQLRLLNYIVRSTLGWQGRMPGTRRVSAYFSYALLMARAGRTSREAITAALSGLVVAGLIDVLDETGAVVAAAAAIQPYRRGLRVRIAPMWVEEHGGENLGISMVDMVKSRE